MTDLVTNYCLKSDFVEDLLKKYPECTVLNMILDHFLITIPDNPDATIEERIEALKGQEKFAEAFGDYDGLKLGISELHLRSVSVLGTKLLEQVLEPAFFSFISEQKQDDISFVNVFRSFS